MLVCAGKIGQNGLENRVVMPLGFTIIDCRSAVVEKMDLHLRFATQVTDESMVFQRAKLLVLLIEKIRAFLQKMKMFGGRVLVNEFQFLIIVFETFC